MKAERTNSKSSFFSEEELPAEKVEKESQQTKALFLKNLRLQSKQIGTNICQIMTPIICLIFTFIIR